MGSGAGRRRLTLVVGEPLRVRDATYVSRERWVLDILRRLESGRAGLQEGQENSVRSPTTPSGAISLPQA